MIMIVYMKATYATLYMLPELPTNLANLSCLLPTLSLMMIMVKIVVMTITSLNIGEWTERENTHTEI